MTRRFRVGPARILVADEIYQPAEQWLDLGETRGEVTVEPRATISTGRSDQSGQTPRADSVWLTGPESVATAPMLDRDLAKLNEELPGSLLVTSGADEALGFGSGFGAFVPRAVVIVPVDQYDDAGEWYFEAQDAIWIPAAVLRVTGPWPHTLPDDGDDAFSGTAFEVEIRSLAAGKYVAASVRDGGGIGTIQKHILTPEEERIGEPGTDGFGVAAYPGGGTPTGLSEMTGSREIGHDNYGNYLVDNSQSVMVWIPRFFYKVEHDTADPYFGNRIHVRSTPAPGYVLHRAFIDGGEIKSGFFVDKYLWSNALADGSDNTDLTGGIAASIADRRPVSTDSVNNPITNLTQNGQSPAENYGGVYAAAKSRGNDYAPISRFCFSALAMLALAHYQAEPAEAQAAWMDVAPYAPKGCNDDALGDAQDPEISYTTSGYDNQPLTGSGTPFAKTTHNGQASGVCDLNGAMWEVVSGLTNIGGDGDTFYILKEATALKDLVDATSGADAAFGTDPYVQMDEVWWTDASAWIYFGDGTNQVLDEATMREVIGYHYTALGIPKDADGASTSQAATNSFGGDGLYRRHRDLLAPFAGGYWATGSTAGVWALHLSGARTLSSHTVGSRAVLYV